MANEKQNYLVIREFDKIRRASIEDAPSDYAQNILCQKDFQALKQFVEENASEDSEDENLKHFISCRNNTISVCNYVGVIELPSGFQIEILPKINFGENSGEWNDEAKEKSREIFLRMLSYLKEFPCKVSDFTNLNSRQIRLLDVFINMYANEVSSLVKKGLKSAYVLTEDNVHFYKGKLKFSSHLRTNMVHKERFYTEFDEFQMNRPENKLIKSTLLLLQKKTHSESNRKLINQMQSHFELVDASLNYDSDFSKVACDRNTRDYSDLMLCSKVFLKNKSFSSFRGSNKTRALLFPMEKIFESYVAGSFKQAMEDYSRPALWKVSLQDKKYYLFNTKSDSSGSNYFGLKPDIVARSSDRIVILDTKWKSLSFNKANYGISQSDMYQMYGYAHEYRTPEIFLLYPLNAEMKKRGAIEFFGSDRSPIDGKRIHIKVFFVDLETILLKPELTRPCWLDQLIGKMDCF